MNTKPNVSFELLLGVCWKGWSNFGSWREKEKAERESAINEEGRATLHLTGIGQQQEWFQ